MKKILGIAAVAALAAACAFADGITVGGWGRGIWCPLAGNGDNTVTSEGTSWGAALPRVGFTVSGSSENIGFQTDWTGENGGVGDDAFIWVKPVSMVKLSIGRTQDDTLRGNASFGVFNWQRVGLGWTGEDVTFTRLGNGTGGQLQGAIIAVDPIEGLHIAAGFDVQDGKELYNTYGYHSQYQAGYTIKNIGTIKAQFIGKPASYKWGESKTTYAGVINAAFDLTAVKGLLVSVGAYIPTADTYTTDSKSKVTQDNTQKVNAYVKYNINALTIHGLFVSDLNKWDQADTTKNDKKFAMGFGVGVDYDLGNSFGVSGDVRYEDAMYASGSSKGKDALTFFAGFTKGFSNGVCGIGFEGGTNNIGPYSGTKADAFTWAIPVKAEYWF